MIENSVTVTLKDWDYLQSKIKKLEERYKKANKAFAYELERFGYRSHDVTTKFFSKEDLNKEIDIRIDTKAKDLAEELTRDVNIEYKKLEEKLEESRKEYNTLLTENNKLKEELKDITFKYNNLNTINSIKQSTKKKWWLW